MSLGQKLVFEASAEKFEDILPDIFRRSLKLVAQDFDAFADQVFERQGVRPVEDDIDDAQGLPSEGVGVCRPRGDNVDAEESDDGIQLVCDADDGPHVRLGKIATRCHG